MVILHLQCYNVNDLHAGLISLRPVFISAPFVRNRGGAAQNGLGNAVLTAAAENSV